MKITSVLYALASLAVLVGQAQAQLSSSQGSVAVTVDNFTRAETDMYFDYFEKKGAFGKFVHLRDLPLEGTGVRPNRDTLYSEAVFDLDVGPVTIALPDTGKRFRSMIVIDQDQYVHAVYYDKGSYTLTRNEIGTRYVFTTVRTLVNPTDPKDFEQVHALQDAIKVDQKSAGQLELPNWDPLSQKKVRDALIVLNDTLPDLRKAFGSRSEVDPVRHLIGTASAWGGNPDKDAIYLNITPSKNDGNTVYKLNVPGNVPVDAFWSVIVYTADGHLQINRYEAYSLNNLTAQKSVDNSVTIQFGGCDGKIVNCLPTTPGWNYMVRLYRPRPEILNGTWKFPEAQPVR